MREGITIIAINRGWLVNLPIMMREMPIVSEEFLRRQASVLKEELGMGDPVLEKAKKLMQELASGEMGHNAGILVDAAEFSDKSIFFFKEFDEVLTFLKSVVNDFEPENPNG